ncbi:uncharacterized protein [Acropora muricata]|uniref:uncharacterized protein isoform X2 n=1 Tax=Acropora muricata TaxID=159855 RepID=UPI0034E56B14
MAGDLNSRKITILLDESKIEELTGWLTVNNGRSFAWTNHARKIQRQVPPCSEQPQTDTDGTMQSNIKSVFAENHIFETSDNIAQKRVCLADHKRTRQCSRALLTRQYIRDSSLGSLMTKEAMSASTSPRTVAIAVDSSDLSEKAFDWFMDNVFHEGDKLVIIHSYEWLSPAIPEMIASNAWEKQIEKRDKTVKSLEKKYRRKCKALKLEAKIFMEGGPPGQVICKITEQEQASFIVLGSRGEGTVRRTILGSVSDYVIHHTHVPVVTVPAFVPNPPGKESS